MQQQFHIGGNKNVWICGSSDLLLAFKLTAGLFHEDGLLRSDFSKKETINSLKTARLSAELNKPWTVAGEKTVLPFNKS